MSLGGKIKMTVHTFSNIFPSFVLGLLLRTYPYAIYAVSFCGPLYFHVGSIPDIPSPHPTFSPLTLPLFSLTCCQFGKQSLFKYRHFPSITFFTAKLS